MLRNSTGPCPCPLSDGEPCHNSPEASKENEPHTGNLKNKEQHLHSEPSATKFTPSERAKQTNPSVQAAGASSHHRSVKALSVHPDVSGPPSELPRKRRRPNAYTGLGPKAPIPHRRSSVPVRRKGQDLISFHKQSCRLFQSLEGTLASSCGSTTRTNQPRLKHGPIAKIRPSSPCIIKTDSGFAYLTTTSPTSPFGSARSSRRNSSAVTTPPSSFYGGPTTTTTTSSSFSSIACTSSSILKENPSISPSALPLHRPHPVSVMSWTSTESRRREYEKIDRSYRGLRGLWKKVAPRWCRRKFARRGFFEGKDGEAESVRRYRVALDEDDDDDDDDDDKRHEECGLDEEKKKGKKKGRKWTCLFLLR
jgi:hypothetical protein